MLVAFVALYLAASMGIGLWAATRVHGSKDYAVAGRSLPFLVVVATVFATWFGSETVLGIPAKFLEGGLASVVEDPFGSSACLVLVGLFFAARLYRMDLLTIGDYFRLRFGPVVEVVVSLVIVASYLGWVSAQVVALGLVFDVVSAGAVSPPVGIVAGAAIVTLYTVFGGMFSVAWTDFAQMVLIVLGLLYIAAVVAAEAGGVSRVIAHAEAAGRLRFLPTSSTRDVLWFAGSAVTMMFGSIPQQDVFQRVTSARTARIASIGAVVGGVAYFFFAFVPIFLGYSASLIDPHLVATVGRTDPQQVLPRLVLGHAPVFAQVMFFGALLSAIMSTASGTLLAPSVTFTENVLRKILPEGLTDRQLLWTMRGVVLAFAVLVTAFALDSDSSIYEMVGNAYKVTLVGAFVPLVAGLYWPRASTAGALASVAAGLATWGILELGWPRATVPPQLAGLLAAVLAMVAGSLLSPRAPTARRAFDGSRPTSSRSGVRGRPPRSRSRRGPSGSPRRRRPRSTDVR
ncbi:MAG: sodium:solute symporter family protein [Anaeromyxobacteraceae bacterium]